MLRGPKFGRVAGLVLSLLAVAQASTQKEMIACLNTMQKLADVPWESKGLMTSGDCVRACNDGGYQYMVLECARDEDGDNSDTEHTDCYCANVYLASNPWNAVPPQFCQGESLSSVPPCIGPVYQDSNGYNLGSAYSGALYSVQVCGDGIVVDGEECDDGNVEDGDGCSAVCLAERFAQGFCDLGRSCGTWPDRVSSEVACPSRQSTFYHHSSMPSELALDSEADSCMRTASPPSDPQPQWWRVDIEEFKAVGTVRMTVPADFADEVLDIEVWVASRDATASEQSNPSTGSLLPTEAYLCFSGNATVLSGVIEVVCNEVSRLNIAIGRYVFITRSQPQEQLSLCNVEVFGHHCEAEDAQLSCGLGLQPAECAACRGCTPCPRGTYSDEVGDKPCTPCPHAEGTPRPKSFPGSTSMYQCPGTPLLDGTSLLEMEEVMFNQDTDSWEIKVAFMMAPRSELSTLYLSQGGDAASAMAAAYAGPNNPLSSSFPAMKCPALPRRWDRSRFSCAPPVNCRVVSIRRPELPTPYALAVNCSVMTERMVLPGTQNFPCRVDPALVHGQTDRPSIEMTACCLQSVVSDYFVPRAFRTLTASLNLARANDVCDGPEGSKILVGHELPVVDERGSDGNEFVDSSGSGFARAIRVDPVPNDQNEWMQKAVITIPSSEVYKISREAVGGAARSENETFIGERRELFIGLADFLPTGTSIVDSASQQISVILERNAYGAFSSFGSQGIDYSFLSFLNSRIHHVRAPASGRRDGEAFYYASVSFIYDVGLTPHPDGMMPDSDVQVLWGDGQTANPCAGEVSAAFRAAVEQPCGPNTLDFSADTGDSCPSMLISDSRFGQVFIPLPAEAVASGTVEITMKIALEDRAGATAAMKLDVLLPTDNTLTWCQDPVGGSVDLVAGVQPSLRVGTRSTTQPVVQDQTEAGEFGPQFTEALVTSTAQTMQDGLLTLVLELGEPLESLEVFFEDVIAVHVNPGAPVTLEELLNDPAYQLSYSYDPATQEPSVEIPEALSNMCPPGDQSFSFYGCVHTHSVAKREVVDDTAAYMVGTGGVAYFMDVILSGGMATISAVELGTDFETFLMDQQFIRASNPVKKGVLINPGHRWGDSSTGATYSLSSQVLVYALFSVRAGAGPPRRRLLAVSTDKSMGVTSAVTFDVDAADVLASALGISPALVSSWEIGLVVTEAEKCLPKHHLSTILTKAFEEGLAPPLASAVTSVQIAWMEVEGAEDCGSAKRRAGQAAKVQLELVVAQERNPSIDWQGLHSKIGIYSVKQTGGRESIGTDFEGPVPDPVGLSGMAVDQSPAGGGSSQGNSGLLIAGGVGIAIGVVALMGGAYVLFKKWKRKRELRRPAEVIAVGQGPAPSAPEPVESPVTGVVTDIMRPAMTKDDLEGALFGPIVYDRASSYYIDRQQSVLDRLERGNAPRQGAPPGSDPAPPPVLAHSTSAQSARSAQSAQDGNPSS